MPMTTLGCPYTFSAVIWKVRDSGRNTPPLAPPNMGEDLFRVFPSNVIAEPAADNDGILGHHYRVQIAAQFATISLRRLDGR